MTSTESLPWTATPPRIAVIGDVMLDEYLDGRVDRVSPEAPVPVHRVEEVSYVAGGAANAARNIVSLGGHAHLVACIGHDAAGEILRQKLGEAGVNTDALITSSRPTARKVRVRTPQQQLLRLDWEETCPVDGKLATQLVAALERVAADLILVSDYGKGCLSPQVLAEVHELCRRRAVPWVVDPKSRDFTRYVGCTLLTPNYAEACAAAGIDPGAGTAAGDVLVALRQTYPGLRHVLMTLGKDGMLASWRPDPAAEPEPALTYHAPAKHVFDVSGAGDTVAAIFALLLQNMPSLARSLEIASTGAGIVVEKYGTAALGRHELEQRLRHNGAQQRSAPVGDVLRQDLARTPKVVTPDEMTRWANQVRNAGQRIVFTNGCFDLLHVGHVLALQEARAQGDVLVVGVNGDASVSQLKGPRRPLQPLEARLMVLAALACVDRVVAFDAPTPLELIRQLSPHVLVKSEDYPEHHIVGAEHVKRTGGSVYRTRLLRGYSTTALSQALAAASD